MESGIIRPLTRTEVEEAFENAPIRSEFIAKWEVNGLFHRDGDLPAIVCKDGTQSWWQLNTRHRDGDLPARVTSSGTQEWFRHGKICRGGNLPAIVYADGRMEWWDNDVKIGDQDNPPLDAMFPGNLGKSASKT